MSLPRCLRDASGGEGGEAEVVRPELGEAQTSGRVGADQQENDRSKDRAPEREVELARLVAEREQLLAERERIFRQVLLERELAVALSGRELVPGAASQLLKLWRDEFDVVEDQGAYRVVSRDGKALNRAVEERLASAEYAHFRPARSRGGSGAVGAQNDARPVAGRPAETLGESLVRRWREALGSQPEGWAAIGLSGRRTR